VGGGLDAGGVHNVLEAAVYGKTVIYGPNHHKYIEAVELASTGAGIVVKGKEELMSVLQALEKDASLKRDLESKSREFVFRHQGATEKVIKYIQENRLLTS
jgi:3-deoxy-D-manno-octulosonic-acid transferase